MGALVSGGNAPSCNGRHVEQASCLILALRIVHSLQLVFQFLATHETFGGTLRLLRRAALI
jgi:hypothetical protein